MNQRQPRHERNDGYNFICAWEAREVERERFPRPITLHMETILRRVGLLKFYEEATSCKGNFTLLRHLIHCWDRDQQAFKVGLDSWYHPMEDIYFIIGLSRRGDDWPQFP